MSEGKSTVEDRGGRWALGAGRWARGVEEGEGRRAKGVGRCAKALTGLVLVLGAPGLSQAQADKEPLTLKRAAERALARAPEVAVARAQVDEAAAGARAAKAAFAPQAFATTTPGYSNGLPVAVAGRVPSVFGVELHQKRVNKFFVHFS